MVTFDAALPGTPAQAWRESRVREDAPPLDIGAVQRLVVLAAHPDDETLMAGGLIHAVAASGRPVVLVVATLGERSHPASPTTGPDELARLRRAELAEAAAALARGCRVVSLDLPDGGLRDATDALTTAIEALLEAGDTVVCPWRADGHPDHEAVAAVAVTLTARIGAMLLEAPIWAWHWGTPGAGFPAAVRFDLGGEDRHAKAAAVAAQRSQVAPLSPAAGDEALLTPEMLDHFAGGAELFFPTGSSPVDFDAMYERSDDPWGFTDRWYEERKRAVTLAALPAQRYGSALEIGCSIGLLADELADRVDALLAVDLAERAVELARTRLAPKPWVRVERRRLPDEWPDEHFDLVLLSETGFYLSRAEVADLARRVAGATGPAGVLVACHWRPHVAGLELGGDDVHTVLRETLGWDVVVRHLEEDFVLEVLQAPPSASVARTTGLR